MKPDSSKPSLLLVDDDHHLCTMLSEELSPQGFECRTVFSGKAALSLMQAESFDAIITDINMPGLSGLQLLDEARKKCPHSAFLLATGVDDVDTAIEAMKKGADDYLVKPFRLQVAVASIRRALEKKRLELELERHRAHLEETVDRRTKQLQAALKRIELTYDETLAALGAALDLRDYETAGHSRRVTLYCLEIAKAMGCSDEQLQQIARGAYLHDIGKIGVPDAILLKKGALTPDEIGPMQEHVRIGYALVSGIVFLAGAAELVLTHQERFDGTGYPQGLMGNEIPLGARIFAVADTLDAMTSERPYRRALPIQAARAEIARESGRQFDPRVVEVFLGIPDEVWENIRAEVMKAGVRLQRTVPTPPSIPLVSPQSLRT